MKMTFKIIAQSVAGLFVFFILFFFWASSSPLRVGKNIGIVEEHDLEPLKLRGKNLKIMSWNVAFALGLGSEGSSYKARSKGY